MNTRVVGADKEYLASEYLRQNGFKELERNFRCKTGEIDIIGYDDIGTNRELVFVEVKYRKNENRGSALSAVGINKQRKICKVADFYRLIHKISPLTGIRYDVVAIQGEDIEWIKGAFPHIY